MTSPELPIDTRRLVLRGFERSDLAAVDAYHSLPEAQRYLDWKARDRSELEAGLNAMSTQRRLNRPGDTLSLAVVRKSDGVLLGQVSLRWTDATAGQAELRFVFNPTYRRQGYATRGLALLLDQARAAGLAVVCLMVDEENLASQRVIGRNGGVITHQVAPDYRGLTTVCYGIAL